MKKYNQYTIYVESYTMRFVPEKSLQASKGRLNTNTYVMLMRLLALLWKYLKLDANE